MTRPPASIGLKFAATLFALGGLAAPATGEVQKFMHLCNDRLCPSYELVFTPPAGWAEDRQASRKNKVQMYLPRGRSFGNADTLIYIRVSYNSDKQKLEDFIRVSQQRWRASVQDTKIEKLAGVQRDNGKPDFESYRYQNPSRPQQEFEIVSFGEDSDKDGNNFFLMVALTGMDRKALDRTEALYRAVLRAH